MTGWRFRTNWRGKLVLQRSYRVPALGPGDWVVRWRDATTEDLAAYYGQLLKVEA